MNLLDFKGLRKRLNEQDNHSTQYPIYYVQEKVRVYGIDTSCQCSDGHIWTNPEDCDSENTFENKTDISEHIAEQVQDALDEMEPHEETFEFKEKYVRTHYKEVRVNVSTHLTEKAAKAFINAHGHNYNEPRMYVGGQSKCPEWIALLNALKDGTVIHKDEIS